jgi:diaminopimelate epimerase
VQKIKFYKYHGAGNDFIMIDNRSQKVIFNSPETVSWLCHRRFGIGADGLILLEDSGSFDFLMKYYNSDGKEGSMCGNGGRCIVAFARFLGIISEKTTFEAIDGIHEAVLTDQSTETPVISLKMNDVTNVLVQNEVYVLDTGSPHYVTFCENADTIDVLAEGKKIRYNDTYKVSGINVNFVSEKNAVFSIRTYERGVEDETYSCGTGTVAAAIAVDLAGKTKKAGPIIFKAKGGLLEVSFQKKGNQFTEIRLTGPAEQVFEGTIELK